MNSEDLIIEIKQCLKDWNQSGQLPNRFMNKIDGLELLDNKDVVHALGSYLYLALTNEKYQGELTHKDVKKPRIYQFLNMVLKSDKDERESNPEFLLSVLEKEDRDLIEERLDENEYKVEFFSTLGLTRLKNQDYLGYYQFDNALVMLVADGVGGGDSGEVASQIATDFVIDSLKRYDLSEEGSSITEILQDIVFETNAEVLRYAEEHNMGRMGTTLSIALIVEDSMLYLAHVGDSRIYELNRGKKPRQITEDHSEIEILYRLEKIKEEDKKNYKKNILRYAIGIEDLKRENIFVQEQYIHGDTNLLLCSDGLWEKIDIDKKLFLKDFDELKEDIYAVIPTDNVTVIRYFSVEKEKNNYFNEINDLEEEPFEEPQDEKEKTLITVVETKVVTQKDTSLRKKKRIALKDKRIEKINKVLIGFIFIATIAGLTYFFVKQEFNEKASFIESVKSGTDINLTDENMDMNMSLFMIQNGIDINGTKKEIQLGINKIEIKLKKLKALVDEL